MILALAGFVPGLGAAPDLLNAAIFAARGHWWLAAFSVVAAIPWLGDAAAAGNRIGHFLGNEAGFLRIGARAEYNTSKFYRYVGEREAQIIRTTGKIPNIDTAGNLKEVYFTDRFYATAGRAKTHNQLPYRPSYRVEISPENVPNRTPFSRIDPQANPRWGTGGGREAITSDSIPVDLATLERLKGS